MPARPSRLLRPARRRSRCRCAPSSRPRRSPPRGRRSCPSTACRARARPRGSRAKHRAAIRNCAAAASTSSGVGSRNPHQAAQPKPGSRATARRQRDDFVRRDAALGRLAADVDLHADLQRRPSPRGRAAESRSAIFARSIVCTQSKRSATGASCCSAAARSGAIRGRRGRRARRSWRAPPARSSRRTRAGRRVDAPHRGGGRSCSRPASRTVCGGSRPPPAHARAMRARTACNASRCGS